MRIKKKRAIVLAFQQLSKSRYVGTGHGTVILKRLQERKTVSFMQGWQRHNQGMPIQGLNIQAADEAEKMDLASETFGLDKAKQVGILTAFPREHQLQGK